MEDKFGFLKDVSNWCNHRPLLFAALEMTSGPVIEFGSGDGSTKYLSAYCREYVRYFSTYDGNKEWADKTGSTYVEDWNDPVLYEPCSIAFIDHAPGEHRHIAIARFSQLADIVVIHDSEPAATGYMLDRIWHHFKARIDWESNGAWASMVSNVYSKEFMQVYVDQVKKMMIGEQNSIQ